MSDLEDAGCAHGTPLCCGRGTDDYCRAVDDIPWGEHQTQSEHQNQSEHGFFQVSRRRVEHEMHMHTHADFMFVRMSFFALRVSLLVGCLLKKLVPLLAVEITCTPAHRRTRRRACGILQTQQLESTIQPIAFLFRHPGAQNPI